MEQRRTERSSHPKPFTIRSRERWRTESLQRQTPNSETEIALGSGSGDEARSSSGALPRGPFHTLSAHRKLKAPNRPRDGQRQSCKHHASARRKSSLAGERIRASFWRGLAEVRPAILLPVIHQADPLRKTLEGRVLASFTAIARG